MSGRPPHEWQTCDSMNSPSSGCAKGSKMSYRWRPTTARTTPPTPPPPGWETHPPLSPAPCPSAASTQPGTSLLPPRPLQSSLVDSRATLPCTQGLPGKPAPAHCSLNYYLPWSGPGTGVGLGVGVKEAHAGDHTSETHSVAKFSVAGEEAVKEVAPHPLPLHTTAVTQ